MRRVGVVVGAFAVVASLLSGCGDYGGVDRMAGKGFMPAASTGTATFSFMFDGPASEVEGAYLDRSAGVMFSFTGVVDYLEPITGDEECMNAELDYKSMNPRSRGGGSVSVVACDLGPAGVGSDTLDISVLSGPFSQYSNYGTITGDVRKLR